MTEERKESTMDPAYVAEMFPVLKETLLRLGYRPEGLAWEAALRMARTPDLASDMILFLKAGMPQPDFDRQTPKILFRPLPRNYTVASLIRDFGFRPVGAFLMASDLIADPEKAQHLLLKFISEGYWINTPQGTHELRFPPVAARYPRCPECDAVLSAPGQKCPVCSEEDLDNGLEPATVVSKEQTCPICRFRLEQGMKFCSNCGTPVAVQPPQEKTPAFCPECGNPLKPKAKFCGKCGRKLE